MLKNQVGLCLANALILRTCVIVTCIAQHWNKTR